MNRFSQAISACCWLVITIFSLPAAFAQQAGFQAKVFESSVGTLPYQVYLPEGYQQQSLPLVLFLHGAGERGNDNQKQLLHGAPALLAYAQNHEPAIILVPQAPANEKWVDVEWHELSNRMSEQPSRPMQMVMELQQTYLDEFWVDEDRVYLTGISMGGFGSWELLQRFPNRFAGAVIICGGGDTNLANTFSKVPVWAFHGDADKVVNVERSRRMVAALKAAGGSPKYTEYKGVYHNSWTQTYNNQQVLDWLFTRNIEEQLTGWAKFSHLSIKFISGLLSVTK